MWYKQISHCLKDTTEKKKNYLEGKTKQVTSGLHYKTEAVFLFWSVCLFLFLIAGKRNEKQKY